MRPQQRAALLDVAARPEERDDASTPVIWGNTICLQTASPSGGFRTVPAETLRKPLQGEIYVSKQ